MSAPVSENEIQEFFTIMEAKMVKSLEAMKHIVNGLRTGRASVSLLDTVKVDAYGNFISINQVGNVSAPEARLLVVQVWDKSLSKAVERAIRDADLGLNPSSDGTIIRIPIPDLTEERRKDLVKKAGEYCENTKISIRNHRRDINDTLKKIEKEKRISEDQLKIASEKVQKITDSYIKQADQLLDNKAKEIMKV